MIHTPSLITEAPSAARMSIDVPSMLFNNRILVLDEPVSANSCSSLIQQLFVLEHEDPTAEITLLIQSPGGEVAAGLALIDVMEDVSCPVRTVASGTVASMASVILACGNRRSAYRHSEILVHQLMSGIGMAQQTDIDITARHAAETRQTLDKLLAAHSKLSAQEIHDLTERDCWLSPARALELGLIDEVIGE